MFSIKSSILDYKKMSAFVAQALLLGKRLRNLWSDFSYFLRRLLTRENIRGQVTTRPVRDKFSRIPVFLQRNFKWASLRSSSRLQKPCLPWKPCVIAIG